MSAFGTAYVYSQNSSQTITIQPASFTETASYIIFRVGDIYYAKNGTTGEVEFSGTNASYIINQVEMKLSSNGGGLITFKSGVYSLSSPIKAYNNIILQGESPYATIFYAENSDMGHIICHSGYTQGSSPPFGTPTYNFTVKNIGFQANPSDPADRAIFIRAYNLTVENCVFKGFYGYAVKVAYGENINLRFNKVLGTINGDGLHLLYCENAIIESNMVFNVHDDSIANVHSNWTVISKNIVIAKGSDGLGDGIAVWGNSHHVIITDNLVKNVAHHGISVKAYESKDPSEVTIKGNRIINACQNGIYLISTLTGNDTVRYITIVDNTINNVQWRGIYILGAGYGKIIGNTIIDVSQASDNTYDAILLDYSTDSNTYSNYWIIQGNQIYKTLTNDPRYGIFLHGKQHIVISNHVAAGETGKIQDNSSGSIVQNNLEE